MTSRRCACQERPARRAAASASGPVPKARVTCLPLRTCSVRVLYVFCTCSVRVHNVSRYRLD
eukprot:4739724-Prymnesium_polylepis.2